MTQHSSQQRIYQNLRKGLSTGVYGAGAAFIGELIWEISGLEDLGSGQLIRVIDTGLWFGLFGAWLIMGVLLAQQRQPTRQVLTNRDALAKAFRGVPYGIGYGFAAGGIAQIIYVSLGASEPVRVLSWGLAGGMLGMAFSRRIPNLSRQRGFWGGLAGGAVGGMLFIIALQVTGTDVIGRLVGLPIIGFAIGLMVILADALFRKAWLEVRYGPHEATTITLGSEPVRFGSNAAQSSVLVRGVPDLAFIYRFENGRILRDDPLTGQADQVQLGVPVAVGNVTVTAFGLTEAPEPLPAPAPKPDQPKPSPAAPGPSYVLALIGKSDIALNSALNPPTVSIPGVEVMIGASAAEIVRHPTNPEMLGLKNLTAKSWSATTPNNAALTVDPGKTLRLERGTKIDFGIIQGEIR